ncbi:hypothetical protein C8J98_104230 [Luteibacter sp. OK325]|nr:hypothetical protein C8J98_104230 [Luteibacter sp. OK325]
MCAVAVPIIMAVMSAAATVYGANQQKHATEEALKLQQKQTDEAASAQTEDRVRVAREQRAAARAASAESGLSGNSTNAILSDIAMHSGRDVSRIEKNRENGQIENRQQARSRSAEINSQLISGVVGAAASGTSAAMHAYRDYIPEIPDAGQYAKPTFSLDRPTFTVSKYVIEG